MEAVNNPPWLVPVNRLTCKVSNKDIVLIKKENDDNIEASLKEGEDIRVSEHRHIRDHFQITFMQEK